LAVLVYRVDEEACLSLADWNFAHARHRSE